MTLSLFQLLKAGVPPPKVALLPDGVFFTRAVPIAPGASPAEVATQVELALETLSPFPPPQLYHGHYWKPGAERALVFAAYRRRFPTEQSDAWAEADLVLPMFASTLGIETQGATTLIVPSEDGLTAVHWDSGPVPDRVVFKAVPPEASESERAALCDELLRSAGPNVRAIVLRAAPNAEPSRLEQEFVFKVDSQSARLPASLATMMDIRDKEELADLRRSRGRALVLWRTFLGAVTLLALLALGEIALAGGKLWEKSRVTRVNAQQPLVQQIETAQALTTRINELSTKRLLPFEMLAFASAGKPESVTFLRATTSDLYGLVIEAQSNAPAAVSGYQSALSAQPAFEKVEVRDQRTRENVMTFTLAVTFRPEALKPAAPTP